MQVLHPVCAGLDIHKDTVVACLRIADGQGGKRSAVRTFGTVTRELLALSDWLQEAGCTHVAMEATGVYWRPVWHVLEAGFELLLANPGHIKNVPGRKTDVNDATWIADLLAHGLIQGSFIPEEPIVALRELMRTRKQFMREKARHIQRLQKTLEDANIKVSSAISDIMGQSGRAFLQAMIAGETDPEKLAGLGNSKLRKVSHAQRVESLRGYVKPTHRFLLKLHFDQVLHLEEVVADIEREAEGHLGPFQEAVARLTQIPGVSETTAKTILAEIGSDMSRFPTQRHLISWAGLCPRNDESAGKRRSTRTRPSAQWLKSILIEAAWSGARKKGSYLQAQFLRIRNRRGPKKAAVAVAASILTAAYFMLRDGTPYKDLGSDHFSRLDKGKTIKGLVRKLEALGCEVQLTQAA